jgi:pimeloyl-ACP methyl ester carboxylesterase
MRVVLIHGRAAAMDIPGVMLREWTDALRFGLSRIPSTIDPDAVDVRLAFYGDIWRPDFAQPLPAIEPAPPTLEFGLPGFSDVSLWFDEHLGVGDALAETLLRDVDDYLSEPALRTTTNQRLIRAVTAGLPAGEQVVVVGFSMGSFVAYDTLRANEKLPVAALITIGSPLAMPSFYRRVAAGAAGPAAVVPDGGNATPVPAQLAMWVNLWTRDDPGTAGHVQMPDRYRPEPPGTVRVQDVETWGRPSSPTNPAAAHNASDYLSSKAFATALHAALALISGQA